MNVSSEAQELSAILSQTRQRIVFAESCTAGMVCGLLGAIPGISDYLCGSIVTYREDCKQQWLAIPADLLQQHTAVSSVVTRQMSVEVLKRTPAADVAAAITGHLGPDAPAPLDGLCFISVARRYDAGPRVVHEGEYQMAAKQRVERQLESARRVLACVAAVLRSGT